MLMTVCYQCFLCKGGLKVLSTKGFHVSQVVCWTRIGEIWNIIFSLLLPSLYHLAPPGFLECSFFLKMSCWWRWRGQKYNHQVMGLVIWHLFIWAGLSSEQRLSQQTHGDSWHTAVMNVHNYIQVNLSQRVSGLVDM